METPPVTIEGFHAVKHALRFGADFTTLYARKDSDWRRIAEALAPDVIPLIEAKLEIVSAEIFRTVSRGDHPTGIAGIAKRPVYRANPASDAKRLSPAILLEEPHRLGNVGATIRVAAAANAASVLTTGPVDPWASEAIRGSAGLHFALPVMHLESLDELSGPLIALDPDGDPIDTVTIPAGAILAFGTERDGLSAELLSKASHVVSLPMRSGVSSLNLATSVAATLYRLRLSTPPIH